MNSSAERQFQQADAAVEQAVTAFMGKIQPMLGKWEAVAPAYIAERLMLVLSSELSKLANDPVLRDFAGTATIKLSNALADYRDSRAADRLSDRAGGF